MKNIIIAGGTGLVGQRLTRILKQEGYTVSWLSRDTNRKTDTKCIYWNPTKGEMDTASIPPNSILINLAGGNVAEGRWTQKRKNILIESRVKGNQLIRQKIESGDLQIDSYISASAIGIYGEKGDQICQESIPAGKGFLSECTIKWEDAIQEVQNTGVRTVVFRIGIVLSSQGGALEKMMLSFKGGMGNWFGKGDQWYSWIHMDDLCGMFLHAIRTDSLSGIFNAVAPHPATNKQLIKSIGKAKGKSFIYAPVPTFVIRTIMGEMADIVLTGTKVDASKIIGSGFTFKFPELIPALKDLLERKI